MYPTIIIILVFLEKSNCEHSFTYNTFPRPLRMNLGRIHVDTARETIIECDPRHRDTIVTIMRGGPSEITFTSGNDDQEDVYSLAEVAVGKDDSKVTSSPQDPVDGQCVDPKWPGV